jgi:hypothetical protein
MFESGRCKIHRAASQQEGLHRERTSKWGKGSCTTSKRTEELFLHFIKFSHPLHIHFIFKKYIYPGSTMYVPITFAD